MSRKIRILDEFGAVLFDWTNQTDQYGRYNFTITDEQKGRTATSIEYEKITGTGKMDLIPKQLIIDNIINLQITFSLVDEISEADQAIVSLSMHGG